jgi:hypothetical protein
MLPAILTLLTLGPRSAHATLEIDGSGPILSAGGFQMRVTNAGIVGNAYFDIGRSFDPSFEFPPSSGQELMNYAALWVGARLPDGRERVSGGPLLEWRPGLDPDDRVHEARKGRLGSRRVVDDDLDGRIDEEILNGRDDDGDGEIDEDIGLAADHMLAAEYVDDRPEAVRFAYADGESHAPLGLTVQQEVLAWSTPGFEKIAGLHFTIRNHGTHMLENVYIGLFADLDVRLREDPVGHLNDRSAIQTHERVVSNGTPWSAITFRGQVPGGSAEPPAPCLVRLERPVAVVSDGAAGSIGSQIAVLPLEHTTDPLAILPPARSFARAPSEVSFRMKTFSNRGVPGRGGTPRLDRDRYAALAGQLTGNVAGDDDQAVLVSCGPFARLHPGETLSFTVALIAGESADSLAASIENALYLHYGRRYNLEPDYQGPDSTDWTVGETGRNGHEVCLEAPPGTSFEWDPDCQAKFAPNEPPPPPTTYAPGQCIWTDADCSACTGFNGEETIVRWLAPGDLPPPPVMRIAPGDRQVTVEWNNLPEVLLAGAQYGTVESRFVGYRVYRLSDWRRRTGLLPSARNWELVLSMGADTLNGDRPLEDFTDTSLDYERILFERELYPPGRYRWVDRSALNGFDYVYYVTSAYDLRTRLPDSSVLTTRQEGPILVTFNDRVKPQAVASAGGFHAWVVPNPYRGAAGWDRPQVYGDAQTSHIDFFGLPRSRSTIKIWTAAGDLVAQIVHDGSAGDGQASWNLVSRNGQDIESGIYLFTVESPVGRQTGKFVVIR